MATPAIAQKKPTMVLTGDMGNVATTALGFLRDRYEVWGIDRKRGAQQDLSMVSTDWMSIIMARPDVVVHTAWEMIDPLVYQQASINSTINLLNACRTAGVKRFVFTSSAWAAPGLYGHKTLKGDSAVSYYGTAKRFIEESLMIWGRETGCDCAVIRLGRVTPRQIVDPEFGPGITMSDAEIEKSFDVALNVKGYRLIGPLDAREGKL